MLNVQKLCIGIVGLWISTSVIASIGDGGSASSPGTHHSMAINALRSAHSAESHASVKILSIMTFDIIADEEISQDDPRLKTLGLLAKKPHSVVDITYINPNAADLATHIAQLLTDNGIPVYPPHKVKMSMPKMKDLKSVSVQVKSDTD